VNVVTTLHGLDSPTSCSTSPQYSTRHASGTSPIRAHGTTPSTSHTPRTRSTRAMGGSTDRAYPGRRVTLHWCSGCAGRGTNQLVRSTGSVGAASRFQRRRPDDSHAFSVIQLHLPFRQRCVYRGRVVSAKSSRRVQNRRRPTLELTGAKPCLAASSQAPFMSRALRYTTIATCNRRSRRLRSMEVAVCNLILVTSTERPCVPSSCTKACCMAFMFTR